MAVWRLTLAALALSLCCGGVAAAPAKTKKPAKPARPLTKAVKPVAKPPKPATPGKSSAEVIAAAPAADWRDVEADDLLIMALPSGKVLIELAPRFAPRHVANIRQLARQHYYDGLAVVRVQDNFVAQWGDPDSDDAAKAKSLAPAADKLPAEFDAPMRGLPLHPLREGDPWAPVVGWVDGFPVAADPARQRAWIAHCYGTVGAGRGDAADSSNGSELYAIIGHAPRALDLNITVVGRVLQGIEHLAALPRGSASMGFYDKPELRTPITRVQLASELPEAERPVLQVLKSGTASWQALLDARRHRGGWYLHSPGRTELCAAPAPVRVKPQ